MEVFLTKAVKAKLGFALRPSQGLLSATVPRYISPQTFHFTLVCHKMDKGSPRRGDTSEQAKRPISNGTSEDGMLRILAKSKVLFLDVGDRC
mmetsp:Transcript_12545/g.50970  ORF Transcript_12545/g.50970 Transcript_12545/m.50970 type:complete len:92 (-) Transcript_12545:271-546(-)